VARHAMASRVAVALTITPQDVTVRFSLPLA
jgi:nitrate/nitrite-specific signal transduction histidine kinase